MDIDPALEGRCGSCVRFVEDHSDSKATYGHCGRKPRVGSVHHQDYKCEDYRMLPALRELLETREPTAPAAAAPAFTPQTSASLLTEPSAVEPRPAPAPAPAPATGGAAIDREALRDIVADALDDLLSLSEVPLLERWQGGSLVLKPANPALQEKVVPIETFWRKLTMLRDQLRNLERVVNAHDTLTEAEKIHIQQYVTRCYGSLTTFNVLFKNDSQRFRGQSKGRR